MNRWMTPTLYELLPAVHRSRDAARGEPLRAVVDALDEQLAIVERDVARLVESWFVETCDEWVVPYLADLVGARGLLPPERAARSQRALVAHTVAYGRRTGTLGVLEQLVADVGGWAAQAIELQDTVAVADHVDRRRAGATTTDVRALVDRTVLGSPYDPVLRSVDVRSMSGTRRGAGSGGERPPTGRKRAPLSAVTTVRPNLPNLAVFVWELAPHRIIDATPHAHGDGRWSFDPTGADVRLFHTPRPRDADRRPAEHDLPVALRTAVLAAELDGRRSGTRPATAFFDPPACVEIVLDGERLGAEAIEAAGLADPADPSGWTLTTTLPTGIRAVIDPERGRLLVPGDAGEIRISYTAAAMAEIGGGAYARDIEPSEATAPTITVTAESGLARLRGALAGGEVGTVVLDTSATIAVDRDRFGTGGELAVRFGASRSIELRAENERALRRPVVDADLVVHGDGPDTAFTLDGVTLLGRVTVLGTLGRLHLRHCTVQAPPTRPSTDGSSDDTVALVAAARATIDRVDIDRCIAAAVRMSEDSCAELNIEDSIVDGRSSRSGAAIDGVAPLVAGEAPRGPACRLGRSTVFGPVRAAAIDAVDTLLVDGVDAPPDGHVALDHCHLPSDGGGSPRFRSPSPRSHGYAVLASGCPPEVVSGGTLGREMGAFHHLGRPQREAAVLAQLEQHLRFGMELGLTYVFPPDPDQERSPS